MITAYWRFVLRLLHFKVGVHLNVAFWPLNKGLIEISRSLFNQSGNPSFNSPYQPGVLLRGVNCLVVIQNKFSFFYPFLNPLKSHSISCVPPS